VAFRLTPRRFTPGLEHGLSRSALAGVHAALRSGWRWTRSQCIGASPTPPRTLSHGVLITGASGLVGQALARALTARGHLVIAAVRDPQRLAA
jgi:NADPH:quinone reductase-like Zn-dependent oxidoreductase